MKKFTIFVLLFLIGLSGIFAQTNVGGNYFANQHWTLSGSPYLVTSTVNIAAGTTLTIDPGVTVQFSGNYEILIMGNIIANGTVADSINFIANPGGCTFIDLKNTVLSGSQFSYIKFMGATNTVALTTQGTCTDTVKMNYVRIVTSAINNSNPLFINNSKINALSVGSTFFTVWNTLICNSNFGSYDNEGGKFKFYNITANNLSIINKNGGISTSSIEIKNSTLNNSNLNGWVDYFNIINSNMNTCNFSYTTPSHNVNNSFIKKSKFNKCNFAMDNWLGNLDLKIDSSIFISTPLSIASGVSTLNNCIVKFDTTQSVSFNGQINNSILIANCLVSQRC